MTTEQSGAAEDDDHWSRQIKLMMDSQTLLFMNDFDAAEAGFKSGMDLLPPKGKEVIDLRGVFAMQYALLAMSKGIANLSDDQLSQCMERLRTALRLTKLDKDWIGRKGVKGICMLALGLIELLEQAFIKGIYNIMRSWKHIRVLRTDGIHYTGREAPVVRSTAMYAVSAFYLLYSFLPPTASKVAAYFSGFEGDRKKGLDMMAQCWREGGICAAFAGLVWVAYHTDTITFIGESLSEKDRQTCEEIFKWGDEKYPGSIFFAFSKSDLAAIGRDIPKAKKIMDATIPNLQLPGLVWAYHSKNGMYLWADKKWFEAGSEYETSMQVYIKANRRSMVPYMAAFSLLSYLQAAEDQPEHREKSLAKSKEMIALLATYRKMKKKGWGKQDLFGFRVYKTFKDFEASKPWTLVELVMIMVLQVRITWWMSKAQLEAMQSQLTQELKTRETATGSVATVTDDERAEYYLCLTELEMHRGNVQASLDCASKGIALEKGLSKDGKKKGVVPMIYYMAAVIHANEGDLERAKTGLKRLKSYGTHYALHALVFLKAIVLAQKLGEDYVQDYDEVSVGARHTKSVTFEVNAVTDRPIEWSWFAEKHTIRFRAAYYPQGQTEPILIQTVSQHDTENKHVIGEFQPTDPGKLELVWDNKFSKLRSKTIHYKANIPEATAEAVDPDKDVSTEIPN